MKVIQIGFDERKIAWYRARKTLVIINCFNRGKNKNENETILNDWRAFGVHAVNELRMNCSGRHQRIREISLEFRFLYGTISIFVSFVRKFTPWSWQK